VPKLASAGKVQLVLARVIKAVAPEAHELRSWRRPSGKFLVTCMIGGIRDLLRQKVSRLLYQQLRFLNQLARGVDQIPHVLDLVPHGLDVIGHNLTLRGAVASVPETTLISG
jgi:hypothetical protein